MGEFGDPYNYPTTNNPSSKPLLGGNSVGIKGDDGADARVAIATPGSIVIPCDSDGLNPDYSGAYSVIRIFEGSTILAQGAQGDGWVMTSQNEVNCTVNITILIVQVTALSADTGNFVLKLAKSGYNDIFITVWITKTLDGGQGIQGTQGIQGIQGVQGAAGADGADGTGLVTVTKTIIMNQWGAPSDGNQVCDSGNSSGLQFSTAEDHDLEVGDTVLHAGFTESTYNGYHKVTEIISPDRYRIETITYVGSEAGTMINMSNLRPIDEDDGQNLFWIDILPAGSSLVSIRLAMITQTAGEDVVYGYCGTVQEPSSGWYVYINGFIFDESGNQTSYPYFLSPIVMRTMRENSGNLYLHFKPYGGKNWDAYYTAVVFRFFVTYMPFNFQAV